MEAQNLNDFNQKFSTKATLCSDMEVGWDLDGCSKWLFYEQLEDQRKATLGHQSFVELKYVLQCLLSVGGSGVLVNSKNLVQMKQR